jgi:hypothetical protein
MRRSRRGGLSRQNPFDVRYDLLAAIPAIQPNRASCHILLAMPNSKIWQVQNIKFANLDKEAQVI